MLHEQSGTVPVFIPPGSRRFPFLSRHIGLISQICLCIGATIVVGSVLYASWPELSPKLGFESAQNVNCLQPALTSDSEIDTVPIYDLKMVAGTGRAFFLNALSKVGCLNFKEGSELQPALSWIQLESDCEMMAQSPGQECLAFSNFDGRIRLRFPDRPERNVVLRRPRNIPVNAMAFSPDGKTLAAGDSNGCIHVWSVTTGRPLSTLNLSKNSISALCFDSPDRLFVGVGDCIQLWQLPSSPHRPATQLDFNLRLDDICRNFCLTPDGRNLVTTDSSGAVACWNRADRRKLWSRRLSSYICRALSFSQRGDRLLVSHEPNSIELVDVDTGAAIEVFEAEMNMVTAAFLDDSRDLLYTASADGRIRVWSISGEYVLTAVQPEHDL